MSVSSLSHVRHMLIDLDGVLYRGKQPLPHAAEFIQWLNTRDLGFRLVSNNATMTPAQYAAKLDGMGIPVDHQRIFTSAIATATFLEREGQRGASAYVIGQEGLLECLDRAGIVRTDGQPDWVIVGLDRTLSYEKLATAALHIEAGARFLATNPDTSFPTERGLEPGAGAIVAALEATTGSSPIVIGKPETLMSELAMGEMGATAEDTAMLGDRLDTDILSANRLQMLSILVLTGVSHESDLANSPAHPSLVCADLGELMSVWERST